MKVVGLRFTDEDLARLQGAIRDELWSLEALEPDDDESEQWEWGAREIAAHRRLLSRIENARKRAQQQ